MSMFDNYTLKCKQCNHVENYECFNMISLRNKKKHRLEVDCRKCGKRMILEIRTVEDPKHRNKTLTEYYYNGCIYEGCVL